SQSGNYYDYASFEEAQIAAIGKTAEIPVRGVQLGVIVKSGSNLFHGTESISGTNDRFQGTNNPTAETSDELKSRKDVSGDLGGRIVKDKLWFYVGGRNRTDDADVLIDAARRVAAGYAYMNDQPALHLQHQAFQNDKLSYQLSQSNRIVGFYNWQ